MAGACGRALPARGNRRTRARYIVAGPYFSYPDLARLVARVAGKPWLVATLPDMLGPQARWWTRHLGRLTGHRFDWRSEALVAGGFLQLHTSGALRRRRLRAPPSLAAPVDLRDPGRPPPVRSCPLAEVAMRRRHGPLVLRTRVASRSRIGRLRPLSGGPSRGPSRRAIIPASVGGSELIQAWTILMADDSAYILIETARGLEELVAHLRVAGRFAFDTEFVSEETFEPVLCLVQVATRDRLAVDRPAGGPRPRPVLGRGLRPGDRGRHARRGRGPADLPVPDRPRPAAGLRRPDRRRAGRVRLPALAGQPGRARRSDVSLVGRRDAGPTGGAGRSRPRSSATPSTTSATCSTWPTCSTTELSELGRDRLGRERVRGLRRGDPEPRRGGPLAAAPGPAPAQPPGPGDRPPARRVAVRGGPAARTGRSASSSATTCSSPSPSASPRNRRDLEALRDFNRPHLLSKSHEILARDRRGPGRPRRGASRAADRHEDGPGLTMVVSLLAAALAQLLRQNKVAVGLVGTVADLKDLVRWHARGPPRRPPPRARPGLARRGLRRSPARRPRRPPCPPRRRPPGRRPRGRL